jgi:hypothetical protein
LEPIIKGTTKLCYAKSYECKQEVVDCECGKQTIEDNSIVDMSYSVAETKINFFSIIERRMQVVENIQYLLIAIFV